MKHTELDFEKKKIELQAIDIYMNVVYFKVLT